MKKYSIIIAIVCIAMFVVQCNSTKSATSGSTTTAKAKVDPFQPQDGDVAIAQKHWQGTTLSQLQEGYGVYSSACTNCHSMKPIKDYGMNEWPGLINEMSQKAKLDSTNYKLVYHYIMARREALGN